MREAILYIAMSLDGFIADARGGVDWLAGQDANNNDMGSYEKFVREVDTIIMGYNTYHQVITELSPDVWPYEGMQSYVLTHRRIEPKEQILFINTSAADLVSDLKNNEGKNIWICGGADIVNQLVKKDIIDTYRITIIPTILGKGIRLFNSDNKEVKLQLIDSTITNGMMELIYKRRQCYHGYT